MEPDRSPGGVPEGDSEPHKEEQTSSKRFKTTASWKNLPSETASRGAVSKRFLGLLYGQPPSHPKESQPKEEEQERETEKPVLQWEVLKDTQENKAEEEEEEKKEEEEEEARTGDWLQTTKKGTVVTEKGKEEEKRKKREAELRQLFASLDDMEEQEELKSSLGFGSSLDATTSTPHNTPTTERSSEDEEGEEEEEEMKDGKEEQGKEMEEEEEESMEEKEQAIREEEPEAVAGGKRKQEEQERRRRGGTQFPLSPFHPAKIVPGIAMDFNSQEEEEKEEVLELKEEKEEEEEEQQQEEGGEGAEKRKEKEKIISPTKKQKTEQSPNVFSKMMLRTKEPVVAPQGCIDVTLSYPLFRSLRLTLSQSKSTCVAVIYKHDSTSFRLSSHYQRKEDEVPALHRMVTGLTFLPAKSKRPFFLPLSWNEIQSAKKTEANKTGVKEATDKKKQRVVTYEEKRLLVKEFLESQHEKLCFNAQEACKVLFSMFPTYDRRIPQQFVDPKVGGWLFDPELQSYDFESLLSYFVVRDAADPTARRKKVVAQGELALVSDFLDQEASPLSKGNNSASSSPASSSSGDNNLQLLFKDMLRCFVLLANLKLRLKDAQLWAILMTQEMPVACICAKMELQGIGFDSKGISKYQQQLRERMRQLEKDVVQVLGHGLLLSSPKQVSHALFNELKLTVPASHKRKRSESPTQSTSEDVLVKLKDQHPLPGIVLEFRHLQKLIGTYIVSFGRKAIPDPNDSQLSRIYATWQTVNTATGRLSCTDPNLQALPREGISIPVSKGATMQSSVYINVRDAFCSSAGYVFLKADYSQMEMRILAYMSRDEQLMRFFAEGKDIHRLIAGQMFGKPAEEVDPSEREKAKCIVYGILYGMGPHSLAAILKTDPKEAKNFTNTFLEKFPSVAQFFEQVIEKARAEGSVRTLFNRRRLFPNIESANFESANKSERQAVNTMIQGTAADIVKRAMIAVEEALEDKEQIEATPSSTAERTSIANLVLNIHDELVYEVREDMMDWMRQTVTRCMERITVKADELMDVPIPIRLYEGKRFGSLSPSPSVQAAQSS